MKMSTMLKLLLAIIVFSFWGASQSLAIVPPAQHNVTEDAISIKKMLSDRDFHFKIGKLATSRTHYQRMDIAKEYHKIYNLCLVEELMRSKLSKETGKLIQGLFSTLSQFYAYEVRRAVMGLGTDEKGINDVLCCLTFTRVDNIRYEYQRVFGRSMDMDILEDVSGSYAMLIGNIIGMKRLPWSNDTEMAQRIASDFSATAIFDDPVPDLWFFARSLHKTIKMASHYVYHTKGITLSRYFTILKEIIQDDVSQLLWAITTFSEHPAEFYAKRLLQAIREGDDATLTRIVVSLSPKKLAWVSHAFDILCKQKLFQPWIIQEYPTEDGPQFHKYLVKNILQGTEIQEPRMPDIKWRRQTVFSFFQFEKYFGSVLEDKVVYK